MFKHRALLASAAALAIALAGAAAYVKLWRATPVAVVESAQGRVAVRVGGPGTVQARFPVTLGSRITATVVSIDADVGDSVKRGQVLAMLDDRDLAARRDVTGGQQEILVLNIAAADASAAKAQADLDLARSRHRRDEKLLRAGFLSQGSLDASDAALRSAIANLDNAHATLAARKAEGRSLRNELRYSEAVLSFTRIVAPSDGVVILRQAEAGSTVVPGSLIFRLADPRTLWVAARIDESVVGRVQVGQAASIRLRTGEIHAGKVARIARQSDAATREMEVNVAFESPPARFAIDQEAEVAISAGEDSGTVVPVSALLRDREGRQGVLVVREGRAIFRAVDTGNAEAGRVIVRKGVSAGERLVATARGVEPGMRVRPLDAPGN